MNIGAGIIIVGIFVAGYFVFIKSQNGVSLGGNVSVGVVRQTIIEGTDLTRTIKDLSALNSAIIDSVGIFQAPSFRELKDFSVEIPKEPVGRGNPFAPTEWKIKMKR